MHVSAGRLTGEYIADVSTNLKQRGFLFIVGLLKLPNYFDILLVIYQLRPFFVFGFDEQIDLTCGFGARKVFASARVVTAPRI